jgi:predicted metal-dependent enzyme (double-stranded beta helix superfamily)
MVRELINKICHHFQSNLPLKTFPLDECELGFGQLEIPLTSPKARTYVKTILHRQPEFEVILIQWGDGAESPIHDHPEQGCLLRVLQGLLEEDIFTTKPLNLLQSKIYSVGAVSYQESNSRVHRIRCKVGGGAVSVHIYSPSGYQMNTYI